jgi:hypothetical protein
MALCTSIVSTPQLQSYFPVELLLLGIVPRGFLVGYEYTVAKEAERSVGLDMAHVCLKAESRACLSANQLNMAVRLLRYD